MTDDVLALVELAIEEHPEMLVPVTGELVDLRNPNTVANAIQAIRDAKHRLDEARAMLEDVLRLEAQRQGTKTLHLENTDAVVSGGSKTVYNEMQLQLQLRAAGLPEERLAALIVETVSYRVNHAVAKSVAAANPAYAEILEDCKTTEPAPWRVTLK